MLAVPVAFLVSLLALAVAAAQPARRAEPRVELEVAGVLPMPEGGACVLVLREKGKETILPVLVTGPDARELGGKLEARRPTGLLAEAIAALGARVREVEIDAPEETGTSARVRLVQGGRDLELEARPSESVALAVAAGAPILTSRRVLDAGGLTGEDLARARTRRARGSTLRL
jgi:uncharacterized protein